MFYKYYSDYLHGCFGLMHTFLEMKWKETDGIPEKARKG